MISRGELPPRGASRGRPPDVPKPTRVTTALTEPFWEHAENGELLFQHCLACGLNQLYPRGVCRRCWSDDLGWVAAAGTGTVWTVTVIHKPSHPAWADEAPYAVAIVELDEGPRLTTRVLGCAPEDVIVGARVRLCPTDAPAPSFRLDPDAAPGPMPGPGR